MIRILTLLLCFFLFLNTKAQTNLEDQINSKVFTSLTELKSFVSIPNDALNKEDIDRNLDWLKNAFEKEVLQLGSCQAKTWHYSLLLYR